MISRPGKIKEPAESGSKRVAIYTRKSTEDGLEQEFNTLDAQRQSAEQFVASRASQGWHVIQKKYDDGGFSGATTVRPAFKDLVEDIARGEIDIVAVYRLDRLSRSFFDFADILRLFDKHSVDFISVTEMFSTVDPAGRLTLTQLIGFAEYERASIAKRTKDKMAATRRRGQWTGGRPVLGYNVVEKRLVIDGVEAQQVRRIFEAFIRSGSITGVVRELNDNNLVTKKHVSKIGKASGGRPFTKNCVRKILTNRTYLGIVRFEGEDHEGQHDAILDQDLWDSVQAKIKKRACRPRVSRVSPLAGLLRCGKCGSGFTPTYTSKGVRQYRYYECDTRRQRGADECRKGRLAAPEVEAAVVQQIRAIGRDPRLLQATVGASEDRVDVDGLQSALTEFDPLWSALNTEEQAEVFQILIERIVYDPDSGDFRLTMQPIGIKLSKGGAA